VNRAARLLENQALGGSVRPSKISQKSHNWPVLVPGTFDNVPLSACAFQQVRAPHTRTRMMKRTWRNHGLPLAIALATSLMTPPIMAQQESALRQEPSPALEAQSRDAPTQPPPSGGDGDRDKSSGSDQTKEEQEKESGERKSGTSDDRLFWALPNFLTVENGRNLPPMTARQKFDVTSRSAFDLVEYGWYGALAALSQAENSEPSYGRGVTGYAKRYGLAFADGTIENYMVNAVFASTLHQDPRYYQLGKGSILGRTGYSVSRIFVTRSDTGQKQFNFSEILGSAAAAGLYRAYHPASDRTTSYTLTSWWSQVGYDTISIVLKEFWPDLRRKFGKGSK
jgi:hypothetical protein